MYVASIRFLSTNYTEWLKNFHFELDKIKFGLDENGHLQIEVTDKMYKVTLYEVPILATVAE
jgi:nicotinate phosphoribosyltransferase